MKRNTTLDIEDVVGWCKEKICKEDSLVYQNRYTIITSHPIKQMSIIFENVLKFLKHKRENLFQFLHQFRNPVIYLKEGRQTNQKFACLKHYDKFLPKLMDFLGIKPRLGIHMICVCFLYLFFEASYFPRMCHRWNVFLFLKLILMYFSIEFF